MTSFPYPLYQELRDRGDLFAGILCSAGMSPSLTVNGNAEHITGEMDSANYFEVLGLRPYIGRLFRPDDETAPGANPVAVLSYGFGSAVSRPTRKRSAAPSLSTRQPSLSSA